jgi:F-type H+-transporting ATPase subunit b
MLEFQGWFFVLVVNFLFLIWIMNSLLFRPFLALLKKREESTTGFIEASKKMREERERLTDEMKRDFSEAGRKGRDEFGARREEGMKAQREAIEKAGAEAAALIEKARTELRAVAEQARGRLRSDVEKFSDDIVSKLAGV